MFASGGWERLGANDSLNEVSRSVLDLEARLQDWLARDIAGLDPGPLVTGREAATGFGGLIDLLCMDAMGDVVVVELKRDKTPREVTAQAIDCASWVDDLSNERILSIAQTHLDKEGGVKSRFRDNPDFRRIWHRHPRDAER